MCSCRDKAPRHAFGHLRDQTGLAILSDSRRLNCITDTTGSWRWVNWRYSENVKSRRNKSQNWSENRRKPQINLSGNVLLYTVHPSMPDALFLTLDNDGHPHDNGSPDKIHRSLITASSCPLLPRRAEKSKPPRVIPWMQFGNADFNFYGTIFHRSRTCTATVHDHGECDCFLKLVFQNISSPDLLTAHPGD